jgi:hypothetical protein
MSRLKEVPLFKGKGRPSVYDFTPFRDSGVSLVVIKCTPTQDVYNSIKSSFSRWRRRNNIPTGFVFDVYEDNITIWRRKKESTI